MKILATSLVPAKPYENAIPRIDGKRWEYLGESAPSSEDGSVTRSYRIDLGEHEIELDWVKDVEGYDWYTAEVFSKSQKRSWVLDGGQLDYVIDNIKKSLGV